MKLDDACERIGVFNPYKNQPRLIDAFIDRLIELAAGAEPWLNECGPGDDIANTVSHAACGLMLRICDRRLRRCACCGRKWPRLGCCTCDSTDGRWSGPRGKRRRKLCYDVAVQAMASVKGDYRGKYA